MRKNGAKLKCNTVKYIPIFSAEMMDEKSQFKVFSHFLCVFIQFHPRRDTNRERKLSSTFPNVFVVEIQFQNKLPAIKCVKLHRKWLKTSKYPKHSIQEPSKIRTVTNNVVFLCPLNMVKRNDDHQNPTNYQNSAHSHQYLNLN